MIDLAHQLPAGNYWELPPDRRKQFRHDVQRMMLLPRVPTERQMVVLIMTLGGMNASTPILMGGAMRGGKSACQCMVAIRESRAVEDNRILMCRRLHTAFTDSTLQELRCQIADCPDFEERKSEMKFVNIRTGSEIWHRGVGTPADIEKLGSTTFGCILPDEAPELARDTFVMLQTRLNWQPAAREDRLILLLTGNPYPGWVKEDFIMAPRPGYQFVQSLTADNEYNPPGYITQMKEALPAQWYRAMVEGDWFAFTALNQVLAEAQAMAMVTRRETPDDNDVVVGIDIGWTNDSTEVMRRRGYYFEHVRSYTPDDYGGHMSIVGQVANLTTLLATMRPRPHAVNVDANGIGAGVYDGLVAAQWAGELPLSMQLVPVMSKAVKRVADETGMVYANERAKMAFAFRKLAERNRGQIPHDVELIGDITAPLYDAERGVITIEPKEQIKGRLGRSPNKGDALFLTMHETERVEIAGLTEADIALAESTPDLDLGQVEAIEERRQAQDRFARFLGRRPFDRDPGDVGY